jgi:hypothetical protein
LESIQNGKIAWKKRTLVRQMFHPHLQPLVITFKLFLFPYIISVLSLHAFKSNSCQHDCLKSDPNLPHSHFKLFSTESMTCYKSHNRHTAI